MDNPKGTPPIIPKSNPVPFIFVTGAAGFIGYHIAEALIKNRQPVIGIDNFDPFYERRVKENNIDDLVALSGREKVPFIFLEQDICEVRPDFLSNCPVRAVIHLAAKAGVRPSL